MGITFLIGKKKQKVPERPSNVDPHLYCETCKAVTKEMLKKIRGSRSEIDVRDSWAWVLD